jgi:hypothetical protein
MSRDSICDFVLSITTSNVVWWNKNVKTTLQEVVLRGKFGRGLINNEGLRSLKDLGGRVKDFKLSCEVQRHL